VWGWNSHSQKWELVVLRDSRKLIAWLQGSKHIAYTIGKILKCRCPKWPRMSHLDIWSTSYGQKKGRESNWQFDFRPLKVGNWFDPSAYRWSVAHHWKDLDESYKFSSDLIPIGGLSWELWPPKVLGVQIEIVSELLLGSPETKSHLDVGHVGKRREYTIWGNVVTSPQVRAVVSQVSPCCPWLVPTLRMLPNVN
jgi:hypothetical protein